LTFNGPHGVISQKIELFITTAVRSSNPAYWVLIGKPERELPLGRMLLRMILLEYGIRVWT
jgi:hypothetical protein